jgi:uncharacterized protein (TIGR03437 family)
VLSPLTRDEVARRKKSGRAPVGQSRDLSATPTGIWRRSASGKSYWIVSIKSTAAAGVRVHFMNFDLGAGQLWIHDGDPEHGQLFGPYTGKGPTDNGDFMTELVFQDTVWVEYVPAGGEPVKDLPFSIAGVFHLWTSLEPAANTSCLLDESCYDGNANLATFSKGVALLFIGNEACSGTLVNDISNSDTPYLLTAGHCILTASDAQDMLAVFAFKTGFCNGQANDPRSYPQVLGATLLARSLDSPDGGKTLIPDSPDFAFVRLANLPSTPGTNVPTLVTFMGWYTNPSNTERMNSISHPLALPQALADGNIVSSADPNFYAVYLSQGAVDHGSSGSGLANDSNHLAAVLSSGPNEPNGGTICDVSDRSFNYTRFSAIYPFISQWLNSAPQPQATVSPIALNLGNQQVGTAGAALAATLNNIGKGTLSISSIQIQGQNASEFTQSSNCGSSLSAGSSCNISIVFRPAGTGSKTAILYINDNATGSPQTVALTGTGVITTTPPTLLSQVTTNFNVLANGGSCHEPPANTNFLTTAPNVWIYFDVTNARIGDIYHISFYRPDGALFNTLDAASNYSGYECFSYAIAIAGTSAASYPGTWAVKAFWNQSTTALFTRSFSISVAVIPTINPGGVVNGASGIDGLTSGGFFSIYGNNFTTGPAQLWQIVNNKLPTSIAGTQVLVNGNPAYINYVSQYLINAIAPADPAVGPISIKVITPTGVSASVMVDKKSIAPGLFIFSQGNGRYAITQSSDGSYAVPSGLLPPGAPVRAAKPGDVIGLWATGLGPTAPQYPEGQVVTVQTRGILTVPSTVTIGGKNAPIDWAGIVGAGLYQVNFHVPQLPPGDASIVLTVNGVPSQPGKYIYIGQ